MCDKTSSMHGYIVHVILKTGECTPKQCSSLFQLKVVNTIKETPMSSAVATLYLNQQINGKFTTSCQLIEDIMYHNTVCDAPRKMATCK